MLPHPQILYPACLRTALTGSSCSFTVETKTLLDSLTLYVVQVVTTSFFPFHIWKVRFCVKDEVKRVGSSDEAIFSASDQRRGWSHIDILQLCILVERQFVDRLDRCSVLRS